MDATYMKKSAHNMNCALWCVFRGDNVHAFGRSSACACRKFSDWDLLRHYKCDKYQTLHDDSIELYPFIPLSVTLIVFQGHSSATQF